MFRITQIGTEEKATNFSATEILPCTMLKQLEKTDVSLTPTSSYFVILQEHSTLKGLRGKTCQMHIKDKEREPIGNG